MASKGWDFDRDAVGCCCVTDGLVPGSLIDPDSNLIGREHTNKFTRTWGEKIPAGKN